jgi:phosphohistidine phosphatase
MAAESSSTDARLLTLIRHASASGGPSGPRGDFDRVLDPRGRQEASAMGLRLAELDARPERLIASAAARARQTATRLAEALEIPTSKIELVGDLYCAGTQTLIEFTRTLDPTLHHVVLVGHNPGISELCSWLCDTEVPPMPTCAVVRTELADTRWADVWPGCARQLGFEYPGR